MQVRNIQLNFNDIVPIPQIHVQNFKPVSENIPEQPINTITSVLDYTGLVALGVGSNIKP